MKYIVTKVIFAGGDALELPLIFSNKQTHAVMAEYHIQSIRAEFSNWESTETVSAGFVKIASDNEFIPSGKSESLGIGARPEDYALLNLMDYL